jgi:glucuronoarabinoxylan endo-1,4-beta-xylanase
MKHLNLTICAAMLALLCGGCAGDSSNDTPNGELPYARFIQKSIPVSGLSGVTTATVEWSQTEWEIARDAGNIVTDISPAKGGNDKDANQSVRVKITYSANASLESRSQKISITNKTTGETSDLLIEQSTELSARYKEMPLSLDVSVQYQHVAGFGGMYDPKIWCGGYLITADELNKMYGPGGLGYSILRLMIYPNESDWAADVDAAKTAQQNGAIIFASPWDCTDALADRVTQSNGTSVKHLRHDKYEEYTSHIVKYITYMKNNGVNLYAVSMQNEPDMDFTYWTPTEVVSYVKSYGATIRATGVKLMAPEACGFQPEYTDPILNDAAAFANTDILAGHIYQGFVKVESGSYVKNRHDYICGLYTTRLAAAGKTWWMTEHLYNDGQSEADPAKWDFQKWDYNMSSLGKEIHMCMDGYCSAYVWWYLKRFYGMMGDNDSRSPVASGEITKNGYILSHYAKYATDRTRIKVTAANENVLATAYRNADGSEITLVLLNMTSDGLNVQIPLQGVMAVSAVQTTENENMQPVPTGTLSSGSGAYALVSANSITSIKINL